MSRLLDYNPITGESIRFNYDHANDQFTVIHEQDCSAIIEDNKRAMIEADHRHQLKNDWVHVARIPNVVAMNWMTELGVNIFDRAHDRKVNQLLDSREWAFLKRTPLKLAR